jgi:NAD(P)H-flavin reductase/hemoglobin-like flavoprotein
MPGMNPQVLQSSLDAVAGRGPELTEFFYGRLFLLSAAAERPEVLGMFPLLMDNQRDRLLSALVSIVSQAASGDMDGLTAYLGGIGRDHRMISGLTQDHYALVGEALIATLAEFAGDAWTAEASETWQEAYGLVSSVMIKAMEDDSTPRSWEAVVTSSRMLSPEVASISVQLDQPMQWEPGQSVKAEITRPANAAPAVRRYLTPVNAPDGKGTWMEFHVRVVPWGLFSPALAREATPGAQLRLSSPGGTLRLDASSSRPALMIAGSTGLAPMLAMVSAIARRPSQPDVALYFGAREPSGLYAARLLDDLAHAHPWLTVTCTAASPGAGWGGRTGSVVDVALERPWDGRDAYACGPPPMMRAAQARLGEAGFPAGRVHTESYGTTTKGGRPW